MLSTLLEANFAHTTDNTSPFIRSVSEKLQILDIEPPAEEVILQLLRRKRLLALVDGLSELHEETRASIRPSSPDFPAHALVVTSCKEETMGGMRRTMIRTYAAEAEIVRLPSGRRTGSALWEGQRPSGQEMDYVPGVRTTP
jgi:hypothetical protein